MASSFITRCRGIVNSVGITAKHKKFYQNHLPRKLYHSTPLNYCHVGYRQRSQLKLANAKHLNTQLTNLIKGKNCMDKNKVNLDVLKEINKLSLQKNVVDKHTYHLQLYELECRLQEKLEKAEMNMETAFEAANKFVEIQYRQGRFLSSIFKVCDDNFSAQITNPALVTKLMFYIYLHGYAPPSLLLNIESYLEENFDNYSVNEFGYICLGFFRSMTKLKSVSLMNRISEKLLADVNEVTDNNMINILKALRYAGFLKFSFFQKFSRRLVEMSRIQTIDNVQTLMHIASFYAGSFIADEELFELLLNRFVHVLDEKNSRHHFRSKDISRFVWACGTVQYKPAKERNKYMTILNHYEKNLNRSHALYPMWMADILMGAVYLNIFPEKLLQKIFSNKVAQQLVTGEQRNEKELQLYFLHYSVAIECEAYNGIKLDKSTLTKLHERRSVSTDFEMEHKIGLELVYKTLQAMVGEEKVKCYHKLPHFRTVDIEMHFNKDGEVLPLSCQPYCENSSPTSSLHININSDVIAALSSPNKSNIDQPQKKSEVHTSVSKRVLIQVLSGKQLLANSNEFAGHYTTKLRQLDKLGYNALLISPEHAWNFCSMSTEERKEYLKSRFQEEFNIHLDSEPEEMNNVLL